MIQLGRSLPAAWPTHTVGLSELSVKDTQVGDAGCLRVAASLQLTAVNVSGTHVTAHCLAALSRIATLTELDADGIRLRGGELQFATMSRIASLSLDGTAVDDRALGALLTLRSLHELHARGTRLTNRARRRLAAAGIAVE